MSDFIKEHWDRNAELFKQSHEASWGDIYAINLEINTIGKYIQEGDTVLDVGCANGYSTISQLNEKRPKKIIGIDYSEKMIKYANENKCSLKLKDNIEFFVGDIRDIQYNDNQFDVVYTTRVLINLKNWEEQKKGIKECIRVAKKGGIIIFSEAFWEPLALLNSFRILTGLSLLTEHDFNRYLKINQLKEFLDSENIEYFIEDFSSIYYLGSRLLRELVTDYKKYPNYSNPINEIFYEIEKKYSGGGMGIQMAVVLKKTK